MTKKILLPLLALTCSMCLVSQTQAVLIDDFTGGAGTVSSLSDANPGGLPNYLVYTGGVGVIGDRELYVRNPSSNGIVSMTIDTSAGGKLSFDLAPGTNSDLRALYGNFAGTVYPGFGNHSPLFPGTGAELNLSVSNTEEFIVEALTAGSLNVTLKDSGGTLYSYNFASLTPGINSIALYPNFSNGVPPSVEIDGIEITGSKGLELSQISIGAVAVPEPSSFVLAASGLVGLGWFGVRRRRKG